MRALLALTVFLGINFSFIAAADDGQTQTQIAGGHWTPGPIHGDDHWRRPGPRPGPPPPPPRRSYLCDGTFWGSFSNGVRATLTLQPTGWNRVNVYIGIDGGYNFSGQGTCDEFNNGSARLDFYVQGPGTNWGRGWGNIWYNGPGALVQGNMENGLAFRFDR